MKRSIPEKHKKKEGAALLIVIGILMLLVVIISSFMFEVSLETNLISYRKEHFQAEILAKSGIEYARAILDRRSKAKQLEIEELAEDPNGFMKAALFAKRGLQSTTTVQMTNGSFSVTIESAENGRNINLLSKQEWRELFENANIPTTEWDTLVDCLRDWIDENDTHALNGAESDDPFYVDRGYPVKNGPLDSVEELLLIKGWRPEYLYGKPADDEGEAIQGIAKLLTVWGDGKVNINSATPDVLLSFSEYEDWELESIFELRKGLDGETGTLDDGITSLSDVGANPNKFKLKSDFVRVTSVGDSFGKKYRITAIFMLSSRSAQIVFWKESQERK